MINKTEAIELVLYERSNQDRKWGYPQHNTPFEWMSILMEEVGELATAMNDTFIGKDSEQDVSKILNEAIQVSAVALSIIEHYSNNGIS
jgi:NTP pyrophosphatase (non-canonical NTP hydrolase)